VDIGRCGPAPVGTGACSEEGAASTKEVPAGEGSGKVRLGRRAADQFNGFGLGRFASGREMRTLPGRCGQYSWAKSWTLRGGLGGAYIGGIGNVSVPRRTECGEDFVADGTGAIEGGVLTTTVNSERGEALQHPTTDFSKPPFGQLGFAHLWAEP